jgi:hypothetical protein
LIYSKEKDDDLRYFQSYEKNLLQALDGYIRGGRVDDAVELCRKAHQPWRAASIRGSFFSGGHYVSFSYYTL